MTANAREGGQPSTEAGARSRGLAHRLWREVSRNPVLATAVVLVAVFFIIAIAADVIAPAGLDEMDLRSRLRPPTPQDGFWLGTDDLGRDVLTRVLHGVRTSITIAGIAMLIAAVGGGLFGVLAGYFGGWFDVLIMRLVDMQLAIPAFFLALAGSVILGPGVLNLTIVLAIVGWAQFARMARASCLAIKEEAFVEAARGLGAGHWSIAVKHILPNIIAPLLVVFSVNVPHTIMIEASLSFVGLGLPAEVPSLGTLISRGFPHLLAGRWWISIIPGFVLMLLVLSINTFTDSLRDVVDVRLGHR